MNEAMTNTDPRPNASDVDCDECMTCPARAHTFYSALPEERLGTIAGLRREQITLPARNIFHHEGEIPETVYSLKEGWAFRYTLLDDGRRKRTPDGMTYAIQPAEVRDMMRRYDVLPIENGKG